jgi:hypothetical protein
VTDDAIDHDGLAAYLTDPDVPLRPTKNALHGEDAARAGREFLLGEYGSEEALERALKPGRPALGEPGTGPSPTVRARISRHDFDELAQLRERTGRTEADLLREGLHLLLERYRHAS